MTDPIFHPAGEPETKALVPYAGPVAVDTFGGRVHVEWDPQAAVTPLGQLPFFTEFLQVGGLFDPLVESCPLFLTSPNAPSKRDVLGTAIYTQAPRGAARRPRSDGQTHKRSWATSLLGPSGGHTPRRRGYFLLPR